MLLLIFCERENKVNSLVYNKAILVWFVIRSLEKKEVKLVN